MIYEVSLPRGVTISDDKARLDRAAIHGFLAQAYWSRTRPASATERAIDHSICLGAYTIQGQQTAFARITSDRALRAHLSDVFVAQGWRGQGLGRAIVAAALDHPELRGVAAWSLTTSDAHGLYASFGFRPVDRPENQLLLVRPLPA